MRELSKRQKLTLLAAVALVVLLGTRRASAHKIHVFAHAQGATISGEVYFSGGDPARQATVEFFDPAGKPLGQTKTDDEGQFSFQAKQRCDHRVVVNPGDGHVAEYTVGADELSKDLQPSTSEAGKPETAVKKPAAKQPTSARPGTKELDELIEAAVARQVVPLRKQLDRYEQQTRFRDILGGIGYIVGMMGLAAYLLAKREREEKRREG